MAAEEANEWRRRIEARSRFRLAVKTAGSNLGMASRPYGQMRCGLGVDVAHDNLQVVNWGMIGLGRRRGHGRVGNHKQKGGL